MKEIKFRGQLLHEQNATHKSGDFVTGELLHDEDGLALIRVHHEVSNGPFEPPHNGYTDCEIDPATVGQFTGLLDKDGVEIYEGDILDFWPDNQCRVVFRNGAFMGQDVQPLREAYTYLEDKYTVTGNIHDKPTHP